MLLYIKALKCVHQQGQYLWLIPSSGFPLWLDFVNILGREDLWSNPGNPGIITQQLDHSILIMFSNKLSLIQERTSLLTWSIHIGGHICHMIRIMYLQRCHFYWGDHPLGGLTLHRCHPDHGWLIGWLIEEWLSFQGVSNFKCNEKPAASTKVDS